MLLRNLLLRHHPGRRSAAAAASSSSFAFSSASSPPRSHRHSHRRGVGASMGGFSSPPSSSEWWAVDGEMDEVGEGVPHRERFAIPRDNLPNRRRKQMRDQFMQRTRLVLKDSVFSNP